MDIKNAVQARLKKFQKIPDIPELSDDAAGKLLENVFETCDLEPSTLPLETLSRYTEYRRERFSLQKTAIALLLILFLILPTWFIAPQVSVSEPVYKSGIPVYIVSVKSRMVPVSRVSASINGRALGVYETGSREFSIAPEENGTLDVHVTLANRQYNTVSVPVSNVDTENPVFLYSMKSDNTLSVYVSETDSGLDVPGIAAITESGERVLPFSVDLGEQCIQFMFPDEDFTIFVPDKAGNTLTLVINSVK